MIPDDERRKKIAAVEAEIVKGFSKKQACKEAGIANSQYYAWRKQFGGGVRNGELVHTATIAQTAKLPRKKRTGEVAVNFCPNCGCNLHAVAMGMVLAKSQ